MRSFVGAAQGESGLQRRARSTACTSRFARSKYPKDRRRRRVRQPDSRSRPGAARRRVRRAWSIGCRWPAARRPAASSSRASIPKATATGNVDYRSVTPDYFRTLRDSAAWPAARSPPTIARPRRRWRSSTSGSRRAVRRRRSRRPPRPDSGPRIRSLDDHRRRRRPHPPRRRRRGRAAADLFPVRAADAGSDGAGGADAHRSVGDRRGARRARSASVDPEQPVYDARTLTAVVDRSLGAALAADGAARRVRRHRGRAGEHRRLRRDRLRRRPAPARVRHPPRARRAARRDRARRAAARRRCCLPPAARVGLVAAAASARVLGSLLFNVSGFDPSASRAATAILFARRAGRLRAAGPPRGGRRPVGRAARGIGRPNVTL